MNQKNSKVILELHQEAALNLAAQLVTDLKWHIQKGVYSFPKWKKNQFSEIEKPTFDLIDGIYDQLNMVSAKKSYRRELDTIWALRLKAKKRRRKLKERL